MNRKIAMQIFCLFSGSRYFVLVDYSSKNNKSSKRILFSLGKTQDFAQGGEGAKVVIYVPKFTYYSLKDNNLTFITV